MEYLNVGKIVNTQGIKGEVRVISQTDFPKERFRVGNSVTLFSPQGEVIELKIKSARTQKNFIILSFVGFDNINQVEKYRDSVLKVPRDDLVNLSANEFYYHQIIGLQVIDQQGQVLGRIKEILSPGANDVWVVDRSPHQDLLLPYIEQVVKKVDLEQKLVEVELLEGLIDDEN